MPRPVRLNLSDIPQRITQRGNNRQACFYSENDYQLYLELLQEACHAHDCCLHAYVLMTNHVHLLMTPATPEGTSKVIRDLGRAGTASTEQRWIGSIRRASPESGYDPCFPVFSPLQFRPQMPII